MQPRTEQWIRESILGANHGQQALVHATISEQSYRTQSDYAKDGHFYTVRAVFHTNISIRLLEGERRTEQNQPWQGAAGSLRT